MARKYDQLLSNSEMKARTIYLNTKYTEDKGVPCLVK
jgi:hypothetical protein